MTELAKTILKNNSRRSSKLTYFESADLSKKKNRKLLYKEATKEQLLKIRNKIERQNRTENIIYAVIILGFIIVVVNWFIL
ncbi:MAG: hypothetical protein ACPG6V_12470 [Flavobacteriales bacterium]